MYHSENLFNQNFPYFNNELNGTYNNSILPYKYVPNLINTYHYSFSSEKEMGKSKVNYILTDKNRNTTNYYINDKDSPKKYKIINSIITDNSTQYSNSQKFFNDYEQRSTVRKKNDNKYKRVSRQNNSRLTNTDFASLNSFYQSTDSNHNKSYNICYNLFNSFDIRRNKMMNKSNKNINSYNNINQKELSTYYIRNNNTINRNYNHPFLKHNSHNLFNDNFYNPKERNILFNRNNNDINNFKEKSTFNSAYKEDEFNSKTYSARNYISVNDETLNYSNNNNQINLKKERFHNESNLVIDYKKNTFLNMPEYNDFVKIENNYKNLNINSSSRKKSIEENSYKRRMNKNQKYIKNDNFNTNNRLIKKHYESKKRINLVINNKENNKKNFCDISSNKPNEVKKIKKIYFSNISNYKENSDKKSNHSFCEIKSFSKNKNNKKIIKSNNVISMAVKKKISDINFNNEKKSKLNINNNDFKLKENKIIENEKKKNLKIRKINLAQLNSYIKMDGKAYLLQKQISKNTSENTKNFDISSNNELNSFRQYKNRNNTNTNININTYMNCNSSRNNVELKVKKDPKIILNIDKIKIKNIQGIKQIEIKNNKNIKNNIKKSYINIITDISKKMINEKRITSSILNKKSESLSHFKKICRNYFSYLPFNKSNNLNIKKLKRSKKKFCSQSNIQLNNINNKTYEEDFYFKINKNRINIYKTLKPQISVRISLFAVKKPEKEKYFNVNIFYSENIRNKPDVEESDF